MTSNKRLRKKEARRRRLEEEWRRWRRARLIRRMVVAFSAAVGVGVLLLVRPGAGNRDREAASPRTTTTTTPLPTVTSPPEGARIDGDTPCPAPDGSSERTTRFAKAPPMCIDINRKYEAVVSTDRGEFTIALDTKKAPKTVNNFVVLARYHFYDGVPFHRIIPGFVVQGGDATGDPPGTGGPGYTFEDELPQSVSAYRPGSVAMANSGPDTNGSQFFVYTGPSPLPGPDFSLFGQVVDGYEEVVKKIEALGTPSGRPREVVTIEKVQIVES
ncbi:MAG: hypothetical protein KatS3mg008_1248 [Acidimicrobiales bacterium]|nr:MAG: hypothetical protein KatS3mg008_1248 [Acidimicrobiales bacterium]